MSIGNAGSSENNASINTIKNEKKEKKEQKKKKKQLILETEEEKKSFDEIKKNKDIDGDFDVIIPNVKREKFKEMIINNFNTVINQIPVLFLEKKH